MNIMINVKKKNMYNYYIDTTILSNIKNYITISFYKFFYVSNPLKFLLFLKLKLKSFQVLGRIYISYEGINAQINIPIKKFYKIIFFFEKLDINLKNIFINFSPYNTDISFLKLIIKFKKQIISRNIIENFHFSYKNTGIYLNAMEVNDNILDSDAIFVDMRNIYEYEIGHFYNALTIPANTFRDQLMKLKNILSSYRDKKIIMYCTGGIRCEISTALLNFYGFKKVYQIYGGILEYIKQVKIYHLPNYFKGKLFVFDNRLSIPINFDYLSKCKNCDQKTYRSHVNCANSLCHILFVQCYFCYLKLKSFCSEKCQNIIYNKKNKFNNCI